MSDENPISNFVHKISINPKIKYQDARLISYNVYTFTQHHLSIRSIQYLCFTRIYKQYIWFRIIAGKISLNYLLPQRKTISLRKAQKKGKNISREWKIKMSGWDLLNTSYHFRKGECYLINYRIYIVCLHNNAICLIGRNFRGRLYFRLVAF